MVKTELDKIDLSGLKKLTDDIKSIGSKAVRNEMDNIMDAVIGMSTMINSLDKTLIGNTSIETLNLQIVQVEIAMAKMDALYNTGLKLKRKLKITDIRGKYNPSENLTGAKTEISKIYDKNMIDADSQAIKAAERASKKLESIAEKELAREQVSSLKRAEQSDRINGTILINNTKHQNKLVEISEAGLQEQTRIETGAHEARKTLSLKHTQMIEKIKLNAENKASLQTDKYYYSMEKTELDFQKKKELQTLKHEQKIAQLKASENTIERRRLIKAEETQLSTLNQIQAKASTFDDKQITSKKKLISHVEALNKLLVKIRDDEARGGLAKSIVEQSGGIATINAQTGLLNANLEKIDETIAETSTTSRKSLIQIVKEFFNLEKMVSRVSFVVTAKFAYSIMNAIQGALAKIPRMFADLEVKMSEVFGLIANQSSIIKDKLTADVIALSKQYGIAATEMADALYKVISAQIKAVDASKVLEAGAKLALGGKGGLEESTLALVNILNAYDMAGKDAGRIADVAFQTTKYGQLTIGQYTSNMTKVVATASLLGVSIEEVSAAVATMTLNGISAEQAFTALNQMFLVISNPSEKAEKMMKDVGLSMKMTDVRAMGLVAALTKLEPLLKFENSEEAITEIFKSRTGFRAFASLAQNQEEFTQNYIRMLNSAGASTEGFAERVDTVAFQSNKLKEQFHSIIIEIGKLISPQQKGGIMMLNSALSLTGETIIFLTAVIKGLITTAFVAGLSKIPNIISAIVSGVKALRAAVMALSTTGIMALVTIVSTAAWGIYDYLGRVKDRALDVTLGLKNAANQVAKLDKQIDKMNQKNQQMNMLTELIDKWEKMNELPNKSAKQLDIMDTYFNTITQSLDVLGITIDNTGSRLTTVKNATIALNDGIAETTKNMIRLETRKSAYDIIGRGRTKEISKYMSPEILNEIISSRGGRSNMLNKPSKRVPERSWYPDARLVQANTMVLDENIRGYSNTLAIESMKDNPNWDKIRTHKKAAEILLDRIHGKEFASLDDGTMENLSEQYHDYIMAVNNFKLAMINLPVKESAKSVYRPTESVQIKPKFNTSDIVSQVFGKTKAGSIDGARSILLEDIDALRKDLLARKDAVSNFDDSMKTLNDLTLAVKGGLPEGVLKIYLNSFGADIKEISDLHSAGIHTSLDDMQEIIDRYKALISDTAELEKSSETRLMLAGTGKSLFSAIFDAFSPRDAIDLIKKNFGDTHPILQSLNVDNLQAMSDLLSDTSIKLPDDIRAGLKKIVSDGQKNLIQEIESLFKLCESNEIFDAMKGLLQRAIGMEDGLSRENFDKILNETDKLLEKSGMPKLSEKQRAELLSKYMGFDKKDDSSILFEIFGIPEFDTERDALLSAGNNLVSAMQSMWSFYWEWEIQELEKQQQKKLDILDREKKLMLANENISSEQQIVITERFEERKRLMQEKADERIRDLKKRQARYDAGIDLAKGLIGIWANSLSKLDIPLAVGLSASLLAVFASQMAIINNKKFARGGYTGFGKERDETGQRVAGVVHANEIVFPSKSVSANYDYLMGLYRHLNSGGTPESFMFQRLLAGNGAMSKSSNNQYLSNNLSGSSPKVDVNVNFSGVRVLDNIDLAIEVEKGNRRRRSIK